MAIAYVNGNSGTSDSSATTIAAGAINAVAGNAIVVGIVLYDAAVNRTTASIADTAGNSYARCGTAFQEGNFEVDCWVAYNISGNANNVVTATLDAAATYRRIAVAQFSGMLTTATPYDSGFAPAGVEDDESPHTSNADDTAEADEIVIGIFGESTGATPTWANGSVSTLRVGINGPLGVAITSRAAAGAGSYTADVGSNLSSNVACTARAFKQASGAAPTITQEGYRWRLDDGDQANATWAANQDTGITAPANTVRRLRIILDTSGDANAANYQLEYKEANDAGWTKVS